MIKPDGYSFVVAEAEEVVQAAVVDHVLAESRSALADFDRGEITLGELVGVLSWAGRTCESVLVVRYWRFLEKRAG
jgi:hypothetical protein